MRPFGMFGKIGAAWVERRLLKGGHSQRILRFWIEQSFDADQLAIVSSTTKPDGVQRARNAGRSVYVAEPGILSALVDCGRFNNREVTGINVVQCTDDPGAASSARLIGSLAENAWYDAIAEKAAQAGLVALRQMRDLAQRAPLRPKANGNAARYVLIAHAGRVDSEENNQLNAMIEKARTDHPSAKFVVWSDRQTSDGQIVAQLTPTGDTLATIASADAIVTCLPRWAVLCQLLGITVYLYDNAASSLDPLALTSGSLRHLVANSPPELLFAAVVRDQIFLDPISEKPCSFSVMANRWLLRHQEEVAHDGPTYCLGITRWKRPAVSAFLASPNYTPQFIRGSASAVLLAKKNGGRVVAWASKVPASLRSTCVDAGVPLLLMEDGFLRSRGLGSHHTPPLSLVLDARGIYFDPNRPSDIEHILQNSEISPDLLVKAESFRNGLIEHGLSKYNVGDTYRIPIPGNERRVILVPGQVANDASVRLGAGHINTNWSLLAEARARNPDAFIIYKPHPDVELSRRPGFIPHRELLLLADYIAINMASEAAIEAVDEVWTMTSLLGLEALLRHKKVVCCGLPFFAGWGLTNDYMNCPRRTRKRTLSELVAATFFLYPRYVDTRTGLRITAEDALDLLAPHKLRRTGRSIWRGWMAL